MELEALVLSLVGVLAVAAVAALVWHVRLDYDDTLQFVADAWRVRETGGCVVRYYVLHAVANETHVALEEYVYWDGRMTTSLPVASPGQIPRTIRLCWNGTHIVVSKQP